MKDHVLGTGVQTDGENAHNQVQQDSSMATHMHRKECRVPLELMRSERTYGRNDTDLSLVMKTSLPYENTSA